MSEFLALKSLGAPATQSRFQRIFFSGPERTAIVGSPSCDANAQRGDVLQLAQEVYRADAPGDEAVAST